VATAVTVPGQDPDLVYHSFPIEKFERDEATGTLYVYGKATDPTVDSDEQIVDADWSAAAMEAWFKSGPNVRVMHNPTAMPAGSGVKVEINRDGDGGHWVKAAVDEPTAKLMVERRHLRAFSVGIARPLIVQDVTGKARGGIIKGGELAEISLVDRPANRSCYVEIAKSAGDGSCEFTGKVFGGDDFLAKGTVNVDVPKGASITFSPEDLKKLLGHRREAEEREAAKAEEPDAAKGDLSAADRARLPASSFAYTDSNGEGHLPVHDEGHVRSALGRFGQQQFEDGASKQKAARKIIARAKEMGISVDEDSDVAQAAGKVAQPDGVKAADGGGKKPCGLCKGKGKIRGGALECPRCHGDGKIAAGEPDEHDEVQDKDAEPDLAKGARDCGKCGKSHDADSPAKFCAGCGTKLPAASAKEQDPDVAKAGSADGDDDDSGQDGDAGGDGPDDDDDGNDDGPASKAAAPAAPDAKPKIPCPACGKQVKPKAAFCPKCGGGMKADKAGKPTPADGVTGEHAAQIPAHREPDGPYIESYEHDAGLPTDPDGPYLRDAAKAASDRIDALGVPYPLGALHDHLCPAYAPGTAAKAHPDYPLSAVDVGDWMAKALEAAAGAPLEDAARAQALWQHAVTLKSADPEALAEVSAELHKAFADANPGPGTYPAPGEISAQSYRRPYLTAGHAAPSPQQDGPNTAVIPPSGGITATDYTRGYLDAGHADDSPQNKADGGNPPQPGASNSGRTFYRNTSRDNAKAAMQAMHDHIAQTFPDLCPMKDDPNAGHAPAPSPLPRPAGSVKADAGPAAEKTARPAKEKKPKALATESQAPGMDPGVAGAGTTTKAAGIATPDLVKAALAELMSPLLAELTATRSQLADAHELLKSQGDDFAKAMKKQARTLDAIAGQPDQNGPYRGAPLHAPAATKAMAPSALTPAEAAQRAQLQVYDELHRTWRESPDATARLAAEEAMARMRGLPGAG
jgi:hypothetical protein